MTLDERVKQFKRNFLRREEWDSERGTFIKMIYDLIDNREDLKTLLASRDRTIDSLNVELLLRREA